MSRKPLALVDLDGTLADYAGSMTRDMLRLASPEEMLQMANQLVQDSDYFYKIPHLKARMDLIKAQPNWWLNLEPLPAGFKVVSMLRDLKFRLNILTRGNKNLSASWGEKHAWARARVPDADVSIVSDKTPHYGRVLVDDWPDYVVPWLNKRARGTVIMPAQPWNVGFSHPQVVRYDGNDDEVYAALKAQKDRK